MTSRTSPCTSPANPGSAAVVAHASESSSGACIPPVIEQFQRWLETQAHVAYHQVAHESPCVSASDLRYALIVAECRAATKLLMQFKLEQSA